MRGNTHWWGRVVTAALVPGLLVLGCADDDNGSGGGTPRPTATRPASTPTAVATPTEDEGTPQPTATPGSETPVPTATPGGSKAPAEVQAFVGTLVGGFVGLANIGNPGGGAGSQINPFPITTNCPGGGKVTVDCSGSGGSILYALAFDNCTQDVNGVSSLLDGSADIFSAGACLGNPLPIGSPFAVEFAGMVETSDAGGPFSVEADVVLDALIETGGGVRLAIDGTAEASCFSETVTIETPEQIVVPAGANCPTAGAIAATFASGTHEISYPGGGAVDIDLGANGSVDDSYASCDDPSLASCGS
jgi:hypothetical protein